MNDVITGLLATISDNLWLGPLIALVAGIASSAAPCALAAIPLAVGYVGGYSDGDGRRALKYSLAFALGSAISFVILGLLVASLGSLLSSLGKLWYLILAVLTTAIALHLWGVVDLFGRLPQPKTSRRGATGALLLGLFGGSFATPCATPALAAILALVANGTSPSLGALMLLMYALGHSVLVIAAGSSIGLATKMSGSEKFERLSGVLQTVLGVLVFAFALYLFYLGF